MFRSIVRDAGWVILAAALMTGCGENQEPAAKGPKAAPPPPGKPQEPAGKGPPVAAPKPAEPGWVDSKDGALSLRLSAIHARVEKTRPIALAAELRNNTEKPLNVLRPFGDNLWTRQIRSEAVTVRKERGSAASSPATRTAGPPDIAQLILRAGSGGKDAAAATKEALSHHEGVST